MVLGIGYHIARSNVESGAIPRVCIGSDNGLSPGRRQPIIWTSAGLLAIGLLETNFSEIWIGILPFSFKKIHLYMSSATMAAILFRGRWVKDLPQVLKFLHNLLSLASLYTTHTDN